jgi:K+-sensing histidine kinase KdpD
VSRVKVAWLLGLLGSALILGLCLTFDVDTDVTAACLLPTIGVAAAIGGRTIGLWVAGLVGVGAAVTLLAPFGHLRFGLTHDMLVVAVFLSLALVVGTVSDRRRVQPERPAPADPTQLLSAVSHDLRNPLSTIRAASSDLLNGTHGADSERQAELLGLVVLESERLDRIVGNLLSAGRAQAGRLESHPAPESPCQLLERSLPRLRQLHRHPIVVDTGDRLPDVMADEVQIDQVLTNLVENAARAAPPDSPIRVSARAGDGVVVFTVADEGPGFGDADGDPFQAYRSSSGSSGLGLAICKAIVTAHGGSIGIDAAHPGTGACVRFSLPIAGVPAMGDP